MTTDDLRTRARGAAWQRLTPFPPMSSAQADGYEDGFADGAEWHAAQQPTREQIAQAIAESDDQPDLTGEQAVHHYGHVALAVLALLDGAGS